VLEEILHFVQNDKPTYVIVNKPVLEQREGTVMINMGTYASYRRIQS